MSGGPVKANDHVTVAGLLGHLQQMNVYRYFGFQTWPSRALPLVVC